MSIASRQATRLALRRSTALAAAGVVGLLSLAIVSAEGSQINNAPSATSPSPRGSDNLSEKLDKSGGVIPPPAEVDPGMEVKPPRDEGSMPVIPPPGSPQGNPNLKPK